MCVYVSVCLYVEATQLGTIKMWNERNEVHYFEAWVNEGPIATSVFILSLLLLHKTVFLFVLTGAQWNCKSDWFQCWLRQHSWTTWQMVKSNFGCSLLWSWQRYDSCTSTFNLSVTVLLLLPVVWESHFSCTFASEIFAIIVKSLYVILSDLNAILVQEAYTFLGSVEWFKRSWPQGWFLSDLRFDWKITFYHLSPEDILHKKLIDVALEKSYEDKYCVDRNVMQGKLWLVKYLLTSENLFF